MINDLGHFHLIDQSPLAKRGAPNTALRNEQIQPCFQMNDVSKMLQWVLTGFFSTNMTIISYFK